MKQIITRTNHKPKQNKLTFQGLVFIAFNYMVNLSLAVSFAGIIYGTSGANHSTVGYHILWIIVVDFLVAGICAYAYLKLGQYHQQINGGGYIYARAGWGKYGRFWGLFNIISTYLILPVAITSNIIALVRQNFTNPHSLLSAPWGAANNFILDMTGLGIYLLLTLVILGGVKWIKKSVIFANSVRWLAFFLTLGFALYLIFAGQSNGFTKVASITHLTFSNFTHTFLVVFFFFTGFESFTVLNKEVVESKKAVPKVIIITMLATIIVYFLITIIMIGAMTTNGFTNNPNLTVFQAFNSNVIYWLGAIVILMTAFSTKCNTVLQVSLYSNYGVMGVAATEGYLSQKIFNKQNRWGCYYKGVVLNVTITLIGAFFLLILPDILAWTRHEITNNDGYMTTKSYFDFTTIVALSSTMLILNYTMMLVLAILLRLKHKITAIKKTAVVCWMGGVGIFLFTAGAFFAQNIQAIIQASTNLITPLLQLIYFVFTYVIIVLWYYVYYLPICKKRLATNPWYQAELDAAFIILTPQNKANGDYVKIAMHNIQKSYYAYLLPKKREQSH